MKHIIGATLAALLAGQAQLAPAAQASQGKALVEKHCTSCHDDSVYTREERRITTLQGLQKQVQRCELSLGLKWFDDDIADVVAYLNETYYRFE
jgi:cytochrome c553